MIRFSRVAAAGAFGLSLAASGAVHAEEEARVDPLVVASITTLSTGAAMAVVGGVLWAEPAPDETICGARAGCTNAESVSDTRAPGTFLTGAGIADAVFGGVALAIVTLRPPGRIKSPALASVGLSLTGASIGMLGGALFLGGFGEDGRFELATPWLVASAVSFTVGVPLLAAGAQSKAAPTVDSPGLIAGGAIILIGGLAGFVGLSYAASQAHDSGFLDLEKPLLAAGAVQCLGAGLGAGIPMMVVGAREPVAVPSVSFSPRGLSATWAF